MEAYIADPCFTTHKKCSRARRALLPARIIDVRNSQGFDIVKLHILKPGELGTYVALSYCLGGPQAITTTAANLAVLTSYIRMFELPQTIRDAIFVARSLGIGYLWVDSLCIIQEDKVDKAKEIQLMEQIYKSER